MHLIAFTHSLVSDWNHGNAHFLRGVARALHDRGHAVETFEPSDGWSFQNLLGDHGLAAVSDFSKHFPDLAPKFYDPTYERFDGEPLGTVLDRADAVLMHEWNHPAFVARLGRHRARRGDFALLFHDTHHRAATAPAEMAKFDLSNYDGVLAFGRVIADLYRRRGWHNRAWVWHEAADATLFTPPPVPTEKAHDLIWVGNWGDGERTAELHEYLLGPVRELNLAARVHGVRYPAPARDALAAAGIDYAGWLANHRVPAAFAQARATVHVPRRPYVEKLPGIPTIRPFEALACGLPLVCSPWDDAEELFTPGRDYLVARDGDEMTTQLKAVLDDDRLAADLAEHGRNTIQARHTCGHRADELLGILAELNCGGLGMKSGLKIAFFGSSLVSAYWNGAATYYRGIVKALADRGHRVTFYEPDAFGRQQNRDIPDPDWATVVGLPRRGGRRRPPLPGRGRDRRRDREGQSGVGVFDELLEAAVPEVGGPADDPYFLGRGRPRHPRPRERGPRTTRSAR